MFGHHMGVDAAAHIEIGGQAHEAGGGRDDASEVEGKPAGKDPRVPPDVGDGRDDDVVARQLREAAEKEQDPELRRRLWEEYRRYKQGK